jgi:hypothetical protein
MKEARSFKSPNSYCVVKPTSTEPVIIKLTIQFKGLPQIIRASLPIPSLPRLPDERNSHTLRWEPKQSQVRVLPNGIVKISSPTETKPSILLETMGSERLLGGRIQVAFSLSRRPDTLRLEQTNDLEIQQLDVKPVFLDVCNTCILHKGQDRVLVASWMKQAPRVCNEKLITYSCSNPLMIR